MGWLKKIGSWILQSSEASKIAIPVLKTFTPDKVDRLLGKAESWLSKASQVVIDAEVMGQVIGAAGPDKLKAAAPSVGQLVLSSDIMIGRHIAAGREADAKKAIEGITSNLADFLNCLEDDAVDAPGGATPAPVQ
jgi:hypothetical protein